MKQVFVLDPGLMEAGGHHAAFLSTLLCYEGSNALKVFAHKELDATLLAEAEDKGLKIFRHFESNFYAHYTSDYRRDSELIQCYIRELAVEYFRAINQAVDSSPKNELVFFLPCVNWEHASALSLALDLLSKEKNVGAARCVFKICCMFLPREASHLSNRARYAFAFLRLAKFTQVKLFASDFETRNFYESLGVDISGIHPCYLLPWEQLHSQIKMPRDTPRILLYLGDAKENKGFNRLPSLVEELLQKFNYQVTLVIQYTLAWEYPELTSAREKLTNLYQKYEQVELSNEYWSTPTLVNVLSDLDLIYCTYTPSAYENKSSGLAWLAVFFNVPVIMLDKCWLTREFERLEHTYYIRGEDELAISENIKGKISRHSHNEYGSSLYTNLLTWLAN